eukprot:30626-Pelagococcus_subviridis.AAC.9
MRRTSRGFELAGTPRASRVDGGSGREGSRCEAAAEEKRGREKDARRGARGGLDLDAERKGFRRRVDAAPRI